MDAKHGPAPTDEALVSAAQAGDTRALDQLIERHLPWICRQARRYRTSGLEAEDLVQEGLLGLVAAVEGYDPQKGASFQTYCRLCATSKMQSGVEAASSGRQKPLQDYVSMDLLEGQSASSPEEEDPFAAYIRREEVRQLWKQIDTLLSPLEQEALSLYLSGHSYKEMANLLNLSPKAVDNALQRARRKLRGAQGSAPNYR